MQEAAMNGANGGQGLATNEKAEGEAREQVGSVLMRMRFSTADVPAKDSEAYWRDYIGKLGAIDIAPLHDAPLCSAMELKLLTNGLVVSLTDYGTQKLQRKRAHIQAETDDFYVLGCLKKGRARVEQGRHFFESGQAGDMVFYYLQQETRMLLDSCVDRLIKIPASLFHSVCPELAGFTLKRLYGDEPMTAVLRQLGHALTEQIEHISLAQSLHLRDALLQTLAAVMQEERPASKMQTSLELFHHAKALHFVQQHLHDAKLDAEMVALATGISKAHLHRVFAKSGASLMQTVWQLRLERAGKMLKAPQAARLSVAQVAQQCGFSSAAHFSRLFKQVYGCTPVQWQKEGQTFKR